MAKKKSAYDMAKSEKMELSADDEKRLFNPPVSGMDGDLEGNTLDFPRLINILQSDKQYKWFKDDEVSPKDYGKMFFKKGEEGCVHADLFEKISGTVLRIEQGAMVFGDENRKELLYKQPEIIGAAVRDQWKSENPGMGYQNRVRVTIAPDSAADTYSALEQRAAGKDVEMPLVSFWLKGMSFGEVFSIRKQMSDLLKADKFYSQRSSAERSSILKSLYTITVGTEKEKNEEGQEYFKFVCEVKLNEISEALAFESMVVQLDDFPFFGPKTVEAEAQTGEVVSAGKNRAKKVIEDIEAKKKAERETEEGEQKVVDGGEADLDDPDLPF